MDKHQHYSFTSESVTEGHPDKVCDYIADSLLDAFLARDPQSHVACEVLCKDNDVIVAGEVKSDAGSKLTQLFARPFEKLVTREKMSPSMQTGFASQIYWAGNLRKLTAVSRAQPSRELETRA